MGSAGAVSSGFCPTSSSAFGASASSFLISGSATLLSGSGSGSGSFTASVVLTFSSLASGFLTSSTGSASASF